MRAPARANVLRKILHNKIESQPDEFFSSFHNRRREWGGLLNCVDDLMVAGTLSPNAETKRKRRPLFVAIGKPRERHGAFNVARENKRRDDKRETKLRNENEFRRRRTTGGYVRRNTFGSRRNCEIRGGALSDCPPSSRSLACRGAILGFVALTAACKKMLAPR